MGDIGDEVRLQAFAAYLFLQRGIQPPADMVDVLSQFPLFSVKLFCIDLVFGVSVGDL